MCLQNTGKVLYSKDGVFVHTRVASSEDDTLVPGKIMLVQKAEGVFVDWKAADEEECSDTDWDMVGYKAGKDKDSGNVQVHAKSSLPQKHKYIINFDIKDLKSLKRSSPNLGWSYLIFILKDGTTFPALHFHKGGTKDFIRQMETYVTLKRSTTDSKLYLVREHDPQALSKSFDELNLFSDQTADVLSKFIHDPYKATMGGFAKVTNLLKDALLQDITPDRPQENVEELHRSLQEEIPGVDIDTTEEPGFELISKTEIPSRPEVKRHPPLSPQTWSSYMDQEGRVTRVAELNEFIFRGGIDPHIRIEVWKFLLGYYSWDTTYKMRTEVRKKKVDDYFRMKLQWKSVSEDQEQRFSAMRERKSLIDKDVTRTDRTHKFFEGEDNPNLAVLYDILMTYCMHDFDLGYVQGMSDLLAPILVVMENEVDAFWCFAGFMDKLHSNFEMDQKGMKEQLSQEHTLLKFLDPALCNYLESQDSGNMYFCFRWLLIMFKREFNFPDVMRLWEVLWTGHPCKNFHLLIGLAILDHEKTTIMENGFGFTEILKHINDMSQKIELEPNLSLAEGIFLQLKHCKRLPSNVAEIIGLKGNSDSPSTSSSNISTPNEPEASNGEQSVPLKAVSDQRNSAEGNSWESSSVHKNIKENSDLGFYS